MKHLLFIFLSIYTLQLLAVDTLFIDDKSKEIWVGNSFSEYYEDPKGLTIEQLLALTPNFKQDKKHDPLNYNTNSYYWQKIIVSDNRLTDSPIRLELFDFNIDEITLFLPNDNNGFDKHKAGFAYPFYIRQVKHKNPSFYFPKTKQGTSTIYIRYKSIRQNLLKPVFRSYDRIFNYGLKEYILLGTFFGILILMIFYNLLYFILLRQLTYLFYVAFATSVLIFLTTQNGLGFQYLWPQIPSLNLYMGNTSLFFGSIAMLLFTYNFFKIQKDQQIRHRLLIGLISFRILLFILEIIFAPEIEWIIIDVLFVQAVLLIGCYAYIKGIKSSSWFVLAFLTLDIAFLISFAEKIGWIDSNPFTVYSLYGGIICQFVFLSISIAESIKETYEEKNTAQKQLILELKKNEDLKEKVNRELEAKVTERTLALQEQKHIVEEQNSQILSSVRYAKTIQNSSLPGQKLIQTIFKEHFILFKPRDIVSGDFYWVHELSEKQYLVAAVDCTGHGIPGAFMSMIGINLLNRIVADGITEPNLVLSALHKNIQIALKQRNTRNSDGMDMAICLVDRDEKTITYSGARNALIYHQGDKTERIKATRKSIGGADQDADISFEVHRLSFKESPISFYLFSDGYPDQFGGNNDQKFMLGNFSKMIASNQHLNMNDQMKKYEEELTTWMGKSSFQVDDILVIGIKEI